MSRYHLWRARDWRRVGGLCPSVGIVPAFGRGAAVDDHLLIRAINTRERLFEEGLVGRERDL